ncbi:dihydrolipoyl dehydrogenase [Acetobacterium woodii]|uniref:Dihydrolipoyl dehydrogenase n=1 Tax=Acetobacterium woodii (strain ATCC 29683 / DSM 1030 / JCM 2381 / KCTC 1655 / WB1) TaxID=931626 RepID=H6LD68_ACEWD|nr:dihydrolipoyl dehydrogenase [Acetobacterium woodii]AFA49113.1 dihydrolipoamide dehydrogenase PdhD [Acetobacterium woodii DSM 1030]
MKQYDLIVVGGGPGGYVTAIYAAQNGLKTALIEEKDLGGTCLNWGCIPTKALAKNAEVLRTIFDSKDYGISIDPNQIKVDYAMAQKRSREVSKKLNKGVQGLLHKNKVDIFKDRAKLVNGTNVKLTASEEILAAKNIVLATGSHPFKIPGFDYQNPNIMTSRGALEMTDLKASDEVVVIGAGAIGMEFASIWASYGAQVTVIEMLPRILPNEDEAVSKEMTRAFKKRGVKIRAGYKVTLVSIKGKKIEVNLEKNGESEKIMGDKLLVSAGVRANTENLGLESAGIKINQRGFLDINDQFQTSCATVYAIGDLTGKLALAHVASAQGLEVVHQILGATVKKINYSNIPRCTYTYPEVASVGLTEEQAKGAGYKVKVGEFPLLANGKSLAMNETTGFVKIVADEKYHEILGIHLVGGHVTELIAAAAGYIDLEFTADDIAQVIHPHPSVSEAIMEAAHAVVSKAIHI